MRSVTILAIAVMLPAVYLGTNDYLKYQADPGKGFHFSTIGEVWIDHDRAGFEQYKTKYKTRTREWDQNIRPYLEWNAFSTALTPGLAVNLGLLLFWLLGMGPFKNWPESTSSGPLSGFAHTSSQDRSGKVQYKRK